MVIVDFSDLMDTEASLYEPSLGSYNMGNRILDFSDLTSDISFYDSYEPSLGSYMDTANSSESVSVVPTYDFDDDNDFHMISMYEAAGDMRDDGDLLDSAREVPTYESNDEGDISDIPDFEDFLNQTAATHDLARQEETYLANFLDMPDEDWTLEKALQSLGLQDHYQLFSEMSSVREIFDPEFQATARHETTMTTEELFSVDTNCSSRAKCDADIADTNGVEADVVDMVVDEDKACTSGSTLDDDMHDLYSSRNYGLPSSRPTMISPKYRQKEERRKVLKLSMNKLKRIEDPESSLRRSVLINNTMKRLQREAREEKSQKNQITISYSQNKCFGISSDFITKQEQNLKVDVFATSLSVGVGVGSGAGGRTTADQLLDITNLPDGKTCPSKCDTADCLDCDEAISDLAFPGDHRSTHMRTSSSRKRSIDETLDEECDVLSQFYLPPTPRTTIPSLEDDEDEDVNVVDIDTTPVEPSAKRKREDCCNTRPQDAIACCLTAADRLREDNLPSFSATSTTLDSSAPSSSSLTCSTSSSLPSPSSTTTAATTTTTTTAATATAASSSSPPSPCSSFEDWVMDESILLSTASLQAASHAASTSPFSCGHSSMLNEIVVYHNLIASFES